MEEKINYKGYIIRKTRLKNPKYRYVAKKGKNVLYENTQKSIKRLIRTIEKDKKIIQNAI